MKREIKFRGKVKRPKNMFVSCTDKKDGEWVYGDLEIHRKDDKMLIHLYNKDCEYYRQYYVTPDTVGQFTGILDKDGKEIYDGDIVTLELSDKSVICKLVKYIPERASYCTACTIELQYEGKWDIWGCISEKWVADLNATVVGNIYDNPELLEK